MSVMTSSMMKILHTDSGIVNPAMHEARKSVQQPIRVSDMVKRGLYDEKVPINKACARLTMSQKEIII